MKIVCNVCEKVEATVLCCADDAALCRDCDDRVHAANKLSVKHERFSFSSSCSHLPKCDICQEKSGYFFCLEDRAVLCSECDASIHRANAYVSAHQRFLLTGAKVSLEPVESIVLSKSKSSRKVCNMSDTEVDLPLTPKKLRQEALDNSHGDALIAPVNCGDDLPRGNVSFDKGSSVGNILPWHLDEFLGCMGFNQNFGFVDLDSPKGDGVVMGKGGEGMGDWFGQEMEASWKVPQNSNSSNNNNSSTSHPALINHAQLDSIFVPEIANFPTQSPNPKRFGHFYVS